MFCSITNNSVPLYKQTLHRFLPEHYSFAPGSHHVQEGRARGVDGLIGFFADILEIAGERGLGRVGDSVGRHDPGQVFLLLHLAGDHRALRRWRNSGTSE